MKAFKTLLVVTAPLLIVVFMHRADGAEPLQVETVVTTEVRLDRYKERKKEREELERTLERRDRENRYQDKKDRIVEEYKWKKNN